jgi:hypothetical protein
MRLGYIYFIGCEPLEAVKIGFTSQDPISRLTALQTGCPAILKLFAYVEGSQEEERRLHQVFRTLSIHGEWFRLECTLWDFIGYLTKHECEPRRASRDDFLIALHDCVMQGGGWHPDMPISDKDYYATGDWKPFHSELWDAFGPWGE